MFWNKIPQGYVETVDGYIVKKRDAKIVLDDGVEKYYRAENAPKYDEISFAGCMYKNKVRVTEDGTPIGYHTQEEVQKLKDRIKEMEDVYEPKYLVTSSDNLVGACDPLSDIVEKLNKIALEDMESYEVESSKPTKRKNGQRRTKKNPKASGRPKKNK